jgi:hypothetical protein
MTLDELQQARQSALLLLLLLLLFVGQLLWCLPGQLQRGEAVQWHARCTLLGPQGSCVLQRLMLVNLQHMKRTISEYLSNGYLAENQHQHERWGAGQCWVGQWMV